MVIISIKIKLNSGFFKTQKYDLTIKKDRLIFLSNEHRNIIILKEDINELNLTINKSDLIEFEIYTSEKGYIGSVDELINVEKTIVCLKDEFGDRFNLEMN